ncbi:MAG: glycosyltransferase [Pseudomonadota bacterium]
MIVTIGICTFRRQSVADTLAGLSRQELPYGITLRVVVADNDVEPTSRDLVERVATCHQLDLTYVHAPAGNISIARNACIDTAQSGLLLFIDDDEVPEPGWIVGLLNAHEATGADVIFGPSKAVYPQGSPDWMRENSFHSNIPVTRKGIVETGYSSNVLINLDDPRVAENRFDLAFGKTGGEDVDFFFRLYRAGVQMDIAPAAIVREPVDPKRMSLPWLVRRVYSVGKVYGHCASSGHPLTRTHKLVSSSAKAVYCGARAAISAYSAKRSSYWFLRGVFHAGVCSGAVTRPTREAYGLKAHDTLAA